MDEFDAITAELQAEERLGQVEQAREILAARDGECRFVDLVGRSLPGDVVSVTTLDGWSIRGRVVSVGIDWIRVAEVGDETGTARLRSSRIHEIRLGALVRISREMGR